jgi:hypothetical protein
MYFNVQCDWVCRMPHETLTRYWEACKTRVSFVWLGAGLRRGIIPLVIPGKFRAGTPIAVAPAGTFAITREFAAITAPSPMVTAPMILAPHEIKT